MASVISLGRSGASFDPTLSGSGISFETGFVTKEDIYLRILQERHELRKKPFSLFVPCLFVGRLWNRPGDASGIIVLMEIANQGSITDLKVLFGFEPAAQTYNGPVMPAGGVGIIDNRQDSCADFLGSKRPRTARFGPVGDAVNACIIETFDPQLQASFRNAGVLLGQGV